jgi:alpha-amylase
MSSVCFYFQVHQPFRLRKFTFFDRGENTSYFDEEKNGFIMRKVAHKCYLPTNYLLLKLIERYGDAFKISFSVTGVALEQMQRYSPETLESFQRLASTGKVEFLAETYYHSLAAVYDPIDFNIQVDQQLKILKGLLGVEPKIFRNTELIYDDRIGKLVADLGFKAIIAEGADDILQWRSPNFVYSVPHTDMGLLLKNYRLSDDIAFRFSNQGWKDFPLTADKFANWVHRVSGNGDTVNLFMDYETFGEHQWESTGIFQFLEHLPEYILRHPDWRFSTPSEVLELYPRVANLHFHRLTSWADVDRDLTAWNGNRIQDSAFKLAYELSEIVRYSGDDHLLHTWRMLQTSDHFYYMCTKWFADGDVHAYFSPYDSPYDAFVNYMNVIRDFKRICLNRSSKVTFAA